MKFEVIAPDRRGSGSYKWDDTDDNQIIPLWVADMDFQTAPNIIEALRRRVDHGVFGYTLVGPEYYDALCNWFADRHGYRIDRKQVIYVPGVVPAISAIIKALTKPGDGVIVQTPVYNCFFSSIRNNGCRVVDAPLRRRSVSPREFTYEMDFEALEKAASGEDVKLLLLCNPHNPAGRCWRVEELQRVAEICQRHGVRVVSDEIHCELTAPGTAYVPYGTIVANSIICLSPSKAFNTAGLQIANIVCPDDMVRRAVDRAVNINEVCDVNPFGVEGLKAAYTPDGAEWLDGLRQYLFDNYQYAKEFLLENLPEIEVATLEATYLMWLDVKAIATGLNLSTEGLEEYLKEKGKVWINAGEMYGQEGYIRINLACPRPRLAEGLRRLAAGLGEK